MMVIGIICFCGYPLHAENLLNHGKCQIEASALQAKLNKCSGYMRHNKDCSYGDFDPCPCNCGLDDLIKEIDAN